MSNPYEPKRSIPTNVRLPKDLNDRVQRYAGENHIPIAVLIRLALTEYLEKRHAP